MWIRLSGCPTCAKPISRPTQHWGQSGSCPKSGGTGLSRKCTIAGGLCWLHHAACRGLQQQFSAPTTLRRSKSSWPATQPMSRGCPTVWIISRMRTPSSLPCMRTCLRPCPGFHKGWHRMSPYRDIGILLGQKSSAMGKSRFCCCTGTVISIKCFKPFPKYRPYLHAIEVYGFPDIKAIEIAVDPTARKPFTVSRVISP